MAKGKKWNEVTHKHLFPDGIIAGTFKFRFNDKEFAPQFSMTRDEVVALAKDLVREKPYKGELKDVMVHGTGHTEMGMHFMYKFHEDEQDKKSKEIARMTIEDWFMKRVGISYKGRSIGLDPVLICFKQ